MTADDNGNGGTASNTEKSISRFPVSTETLYTEVWAKPMTALGKEYGVSSSYLARVCTRLNVPRPERGYWAKLAVGKVIEKPALPIEQTITTLTGEERDAALERLDIARHMIGESDALDTLKSWRTPAERLSLSSF